VFDRDSVGLRATIRFAREHRDPDALARTLARFGQASHRRSPQQRLALGGRQLSYYPPTNLKGSQLLTQTVTEDALDARYAVVALSVASMGSRQLFLVLCGVCWVFSVGLVGGELFGWLVRWFGVAVVISSSGACCGRYVGVGVGGGASSAPG